MGIAFVLFSTHLMLLLLLHEALPIPQQPELIEPTKASTYLPTVGLVLAVVGLIEFTKWFTKRKRSTCAAVNDCIEDGSSASSSIIRKDSVFCRTMNETKQIFQHSQLHQENSPAPEDSPSKAADCICGIPKGIFNTDTAIRLILKHMADRLKALQAAIVELKSGRTFISVNVRQADGEFSVLPPIPVLELQALDYGACNPKLICNQFIVCPNRSRRNVVVFIMPSKDPIVIKAALQALSKMKPALNSLLSALTPSVSGFNAGDKMADKNATPNIDAATSEQLETLNGLADLFEGHLLKRFIGTPNQPNEKCILLNDHWNPSGRHAFKEACWRYVCKHEPLIFALPAFPFKSGNRKQKVITRLPDMGEKLAMQRLDRFLTEIPKIYPPGGQLVLFSDGRVYGDLFRIPDEVIDAYETAMYIIHPTPWIHWTSLDAFFPRLSNDERREALLDLFGSDPSVVAKCINQDPDYRVSYCGFKKFLSEELAITDIPLKKMRNHVSCVAKQLMQRTDAYAQFIRLLFPNCIRLSIHPSINTKKFSINLIGNDDWGTPWHNCALQLSDGRWTIMKRQAAEAAGYHIALSTDGLPYFVMPKTLEIA